MARKPGKDGSRDRAAAAQARRDADKQEIRAQALRRYARIQGGRPRMCSGNPTDDQARINSGVPWARKPKVIFNSVADAEAFAAIVRGLDGVVQTAYLCPFSQHGHAHLTSED